MLATPRLVWACAVKDIRSALTEKSTLVQSVTLPVNYLIAMILFALAGSAAPTAVVMYDHGRFARQFVAAMQQAGSFRIEMASPAEARAQMNAGTLVSVVTIPASFDRDVASHRFVSVHCEVDGLDEDLTDDAMRGMREAVTMFYTTAQPPAPHAGPVAIVDSQRNEYPATAGYIPFLAISVTVIALMVSGMLQGGNAAARDYETGTIKTLLLAPAPRLAVLAGRMIGAFVVSLPAAAAVLAVVIFIAGDHPAHLLMVGGVCLLTLAVFTAAGTVIGLLVKDRATVAILVRAVPVPLFFLSGVFGTLTFQTHLIQEIGIGLPTHYAIVLEQLAFRGFTTGTFTPLADALILGGYITACTLLAALLLQLGRPGRRLG